MTDDALIPKTNWQSRVYLVGGLAGIIVGLLAAYFYVRATEESGSGPVRIKSMDALSLAVALLALIRQITDLGAKSGK